MVEDDFASRYHMPADVIHDLWNYDGIHQDLWLFYNIGEELANGNSFPNWVEGNEFRAIRDATEYLRER
jgi:Zn-dependent M28 family amino/carboxypeptidase